MALTEKQQYWANHLQQADAFDGSMADYAKSQGLLPKVLYQWRGLLRQRGILPVPAAPTFTELTTSEGAQASCTLTLTLGSAQLQFDRLPDEAWLARLIAAHG